jgi:hypothetical protein
VTRREREIERAVRARDTERKGNKEGDIKRGVEQG